MMAELFELSQSCSSLIIWIKTMVEGTSCCRFTTGITLGGMVLMVRPSRTGEALAMRTGSR